MVRWNAGNNSKAEVSDRWSQTYVNRDKSPERRPPSRGPPSSDTTTEPRTARSVSPTKRFPRPNTNSSINASQPLAARVTAHITSTTSYRPPSPLKYSTSDPASPTARAAFGIIPSPHTSELSKAYGSVLQPKNSLNNHCCAICSTTFPPDATIYPDPHASSTSNRFLCRACFTTNGGSKGDCAECHRPVLILKSEGGFVENSGRVWHKRCFRCESCSRSIGDAPMVDLMGRPCCADCFDNCLKKSPGRDSAKSSPRRPYDSPGNREKMGNIGGLGGGRKSREGSPAIEELEQRLGIIKSRESSPALEELSQRMSAVSGRTPTKDSPSRTSAMQRSSGSRESSPLVDRRGRGRSITEIGSSPFASPRTRSRSRVALDRLTSPELSSSPSQIIYDKFASPEHETKVQHTGSPVPDDAVEQMKQRFLRHAASSSSLSSNAASSVSPLRELSRQSSPVVKSPTPQKPISRIPLSTSKHGSPSLRSSYSTSSLASARSSYAETDSSLSSTPDLTSDFSDTLTESSAPSSPPAFSTPSYRNDIFTSGQRLYPGSETTDDDDDEAFNTRRTPTPKSKAKPLPNGTSTAPPSHNSCGACGSALFTKKGSGKYVTVPEESRTTGPSSKTYHIECFRCRVCQGTFKETGTGQAIFVRGEQGACHPEVYWSFPVSSIRLTVSISQCAPPEKIKTWSVPSSRISYTTPIKDPAPSPPKSTATASKYAGSSRYNMHPQPTAPTITTSFPRFGSSATCPGCRKSVSAMEKGVVPGPQGMKWHATCLVCGGKDTANKGRRDDIKQAGCGKRLDSAAKCDGEGGVWCRECLVSLT